MQRPPAPDRTLRWELHPAPATDAAPGPALAALAAGVADAVAAAAGAGDYTWHGDAPVTHASDVTLPPWWGSRPGEACAWGEASFGDAVDDEWLATAALLDATAAAPGVVGRVWDDDGERRMAKDA